MLKKLLEKRAAAIARCNELQAVAETREFTPEERIELRSKLDDIKQLTVDIKDAEELVAAQSQQEADEARAAASTETREDQKTKRPGAAATVHDNAEDKPWGNGGDTPQAKRAGFGEFLIAIRNVAEDNGYDPRLRKSDLRQSQVRAAAGLSETVASDGGFLVTQDIGQTLQKAAFDTGLLAKQTTEIPISTTANGIKIPSINETSRADGSRWGGVQVYWADEAGAATATKPNFGKVELNLKKLIGLCYITDELQSDASAMGAYISQAFTEEFAFKLDDAVIRGSGAGAPLGILNATAAVVSVAKETSQAAATILYANVSKMKQRMLPRSFQRSAWFINVDCQPQLEKLFIPATTVDGTQNVGGFPAYMPAGGASNAPYGTLFGRPVVPIEQAETCGTVGDIMLLDLGMYLMATKGGVQTASSIHVKFTTDESAYRFVMRVDGQPALKSAITPYKGAGTLSPFVTLATR